MGDHADDKDIKSSSISSIVTTSGYDRTRIAVDDHGETSDCASHSSPNNVTSQSHLATTTVRPAFDSDGPSNSIDGDGMGKGKQRAETQPSTNASSLTPHNTTSLPSDTSKKAFHFVTAPRSTTTEPFHAGPSHTASPYGSSHPLYLAATKNRLHGSLPSASVRDSQSESLSSASLQSENKETPKSRASVELPVAADKTILKPEEDTEAEEESFKVPELSQASTSQEIMGSRSTYPRSRMRIERRPSPLDLPVPIKRRRTSGSTFTVIKVEQSEDETTFLLRSKSPSLPPHDEASETEAHVGYSSYKVSEPLDTTGLQTSAQPSRHASPASSVDLRSTAAEDDACSCFEDELRTPKLRVPLRLPRPNSVRGLDLSGIVFDSSLNEVPLQYILDNIKLQGPSLLSTVVDSSIAIPTTSRLASSPSSGPAIPSTVAVRTPLQLAEHSTLPEYALAVSSDEVKQVMFLPVHGLVLSTSCKSFAGLACPPAGETPSAQEGEYTIRILPVVHIHLPSSLAFSRLVPFFYTQEANSLLAALLPVQHLEPISLSAAQQSPALLASQLASLDQSLLARYIHFNHSVWKTAVALGAGRDELWTTLSASWSALIAALSIQHKRCTFTKTEA